MTPFILHLFGWFCRNTLPEYSSNFLSPIFARFCASKQERNPARNLKRDRDENHIRAQIERLRHDQVDF